MIIRLIACVAPLLFAAAANAGDRIVDCLLEVRGHVYLKGRCNFSPQSDGSFSIGAGDGKTGSPYFAYVNKDEDGTANAFWNENPQSTHAHAFLGIVTRHGACWSNAATKICAR